MLVDLAQVFLKKGREQKFWLPNSQILLAVSGGVDSMVLLHLMELVRGDADNHVAIGVAHINHQLRPESLEEEAFLREYCQQHQIPLFVKRWESLPTAGMEEAARKFRYQFFSELMRKSHYDTLMTAHHGDDQLETMLMKMLRDGNVQTAGGMKEKRAFAGGRLIRPLLSFGKEELLTYAQAQEIHYYDDATNYLLEVQRNRIRQLVVPPLKAENTQALAHFGQLAQQLQWLTDWQQQHSRRWFDREVTVKSESLHVPVASLTTLTAGEQFFNLQYCGQRIRENWQVTLSQEQLQQILSSLAGGKPQWSVSLVGGWQFRREYDTLVFGPASLVTTASEPDRLAESKEQPIHLKLGETTFLSQHEWVGLLAVHQDAASGNFYINADDIPEKVKLWSEIDQPLPVQFPTEVVFRKRQAGDRIQLTNALRKKVSRILIDKKTPNEMRERSWVMATKEGQLLGVLPQALSYLSIAQETDKIHYRLLYKYQEVANRG
ncbi:tRNA lysidine(34) synthetase TilS [Enterococcus diestrammenae]|uniref:tRNA lysidine(34) synthetase TilS n=1 Tax=Enterococcus TaxID=1350 RepID=UPI00192A6951|nr:tRNA lysidine(34) synthetase TilS [Enterococcus diestrammenae]